MRPSGYVPGDHIAVCYQCGMTFLASTMKKHWQGYYVCARDWEERHPQDFVRAIKENPTVPWSQPPPEDTFVLFCTLNGKSAIPGCMIPGCSLPGNPVYDPATDPTDP